MASTTNLKEPELPPPKRSIPGAGSPQISEVFLDHTDPRQFSNPHDALQSPTVPRFQHQEVELVADLMEQGPTASIGTENDQALIAVCAPANIGECAPCQPSVGTAGCCRPAH
jgi:hypothetical protein